MFIWSEHRKDSIGEATQDVWTRCTITYVQGCCIKSHLHEICRVHFYQTRRRNTELLRSNGELKLPAPQIRRNSPATNWVVTSVTVSLRAESESLSTSLICVNLNWSVCFTFVQFCILEHVKTTLFSRMSSVIVTHYICKNPKTGLSNLQLAQYEWKWQCLSLPSMDATTTF